MRSFFTQVPSFVNENEWGIYLFSEESFFRILIPLVIHFPDATFPPIVFHLFHRVQS